MANNPYVNKVQTADGTTIIDISDTTATADKILTGYGAFGADGAWMDGTASEGADLPVWQGSDDYVYVSDTADAPVEIYADDGYVVLDMAPAALNLQTKTRTYTPTESQQTDTITADSGYDGLGEVDVTVGAISSTYVGSGITRRSSSDLTASGATITAPSGYYSASASKSVTTTTHLSPTASINTSTGLVTASHTQTEGYVSAGTTTGTLQLTTQGAATITPSTSAQTAVAAGRYTTGAVTVAAMPSGTAGTPTATKGSVSNHAVTVTPSVTNTSGYISGGTKTGTAVTVSASELVSGSETKTENGTYDVTNLASLVVNVPSSTPTLITKSITENGTYSASSDSADGYSSVTVNVSGGGGSASASKKQINFIDYDGTILYSYTASEWASVTSLPSNPSHSGLTAQGWNWTKAQIDAQLTAMPDGDVWVGQMYITESGDTEIDVIFADSARLSPMMTIAVNGTITVDWGDNTTADTVTGTSLTTRQAVPHTYASVGSYTIKIHVVSGSFQFYGSSSYMLLRKNTTANENRVYANTIQAVRFGNGVTSIGSSAFNSCYSLASVTIPSGVTSIGSSAFGNCYSLASVTIPSGVTSIENSAFGNCYSLASVTIPSGVTSIGTQAFQNCYSLASVTIPSGVTSIESYAFYYCYSLASITIPSGVTSIGNSAFYNCYSLASVTIPNGVTSIGTQVFYYCYGMAGYHFLPTTPPTLANTNAFTGIVSDCKIYVPSESLEAYQTATNWSTYASYMEGE